MRNKKTTEDLLKEVDSLPNFDFENDKDFVADYLAGKWTKKILKDRQIRKERRENGCN